MAAAPAVVAIGPEVPTCRAALGEGDIACRLAASRAAELTRRARSVASTAMGWVDSVINAGIPTLDLSWAASESTHTGVADLALATWLVTCTTMMRVRPDTDTDLATGDLRWRAAEGGFGAWTVIRAAEVGQRGNEAGESSARRPRRVYSGCPHAAPYRPMRCAGKVGPRACHSPERAVV